jgi:nuclear receptor subfamily 1 group F member 4
MFTPRMFDMWSSVTTKLEAHTPMQTNIQPNSVQNSSSGSIKGNPDAVELFYIIFF